MSEENIKAESSKEAPGAETANQPSETAPGLTESDERRVEDLIHATLKEVGQSGGWDLSGIESEPGSLEGSRSSQFIGGGGIVDALEWVRTHASQELIGTPREDLRIMIISASKFEQLSNKTAEILQEAALAFERIGKDQQEIEQLETETRALLKQLRAA